MERRRNGFNRPFSNDQMMSWIAEPVTAAMFYLIVCTFTFDNTQIALLVVFSTLLVAHLCFWLTCSLRDPSKPGGISWPCMRKAQEATRYCNVCKKNVIGLDHHCTWLNTCIGKQQYWAFFSLVTVGFFMYWFAAIMFILIMTIWRSEQVEDKAVDILGSLTTFYVLIGIATAFVGSIAIGFSVLFSFHLFLQTTGLGTYAWMVDGRRKQQQLIKEKASNKSTTVIDTNSEDLTV